MAANRIIVGPIDSPEFTFTGNSILSINPVMGVSVAAEELSIDSFEPEISYDDTDGRLRALDYATAVYFYRDSTQVAKFYLQQVRRTGRTRYVLECTSFIGLFDSETFYGGMYAGATFREVADQIITAQGLERYKLLSAFRTQSTGRQTDIYGVLISSDGYGSATYTTRLRCRFVYRDYSGYSGNSYILCGCARYGVQLKHYSTSSSYGKTHTVQLVYNGTTYNLSNSGDVRANDEIYVDCDPANGTATCRVTRGSTLVRSKTISLTPPVSADSLPMYIAGGGTNTSGAAVRHYYSADFMEYTLDNSGTLILDMKAKKTIDGGTVIVSNGVTGYSAEILCAEGPEDYLIFAAAGSDYDTICYDPMNAEILQCVSFDSPSWP